jgi:putative FmdB family regulatory protein
LRLSGTTINGQDKKDLDFDEYVIIVIGISAWRFAMPIYEYVCKDCKEEFEIMQSITETPIDVCSKCGGMLRKLISNNSFILKGSGWYVTDYGSRKGNGEKAHKKDKATESSNVDKKSKEVTKKDDG